MVMFSPIRTRKWGLGSKPFSIRLSPHLDLVGLGYSFYTQHKSNEKKLPFQK